MQTPAFATATPISVSGPHVSTHVSPQRRAPSASAAPMSRRAALRLAGAALAMPLLPSLAASKAKTAMTGDYKVDAKLMLDDMRKATELTRGAEGMADTVAKTRADMNDFVALYRRNGKVSGSTSYSVLYTASNTLSGHYASYGPLYPVPEKRKKRLVQQFTEVERALARGR